MMYVWIWCTALLGEAKQSVAPLGKARVSLRYEMWRDAGKMQTIRCIAMQGDARIGVVRQGKGFS